MNRPLLALVFALTATACGDGDDPPGDVTVYWGFVRNTATGAVLFDAQDPGGSVDGACAESGVEYVRVTTLDGRDVDPALVSGVQGVPRGAVPCVLSGAHGATFRVIGAGTHTWNVTGYRTFQGREIPVAQSSAQFNVRPDRLSEVVVDVQPIQDDVQLVPAPWNATNNAEITCAESGINEIDVLIFTFAGDPPFPVVNQTTLGCGPITVRLDRDDYEVRLRGFPSSAATVPTHDTNSNTTRCEPTFITQLGPDGGGTNWVLDMRNVVGAAACP